MKKIYFTPGPTETYPQLKQYINEAVDDRICSISHRGREFERIFQDAVASLKRLLSVPDDFCVFFLGSATEAMERIVENCVEKKSFHFVNGEFSKRFFLTAQELGKTPNKFEAAMGYGFDFSSVGIPDDTELVCFTQNETSTGVAIPVDEIHDMKKRYPEKLFAVDIVSSAPYADIDYSLIDCAFFSVQKGFGMPAGLGILLVNKKIIEKSSSMQSRNLNIGSYHSFPSLLKSAEKNQTPETPNVLAIYLLEKICDDLNKIGIKKIRSDTERKSGLIYNFFNEHQKYKPFVKNKNVQSKTVIAIDTLDDTQKIMQRLAENGIIVGAGYKELKDKQIRIANFPMHKIEDVGRMLSYTE